MTAARRDSAPRVAQRLHRRRRRVVPHLRRRRRARARALGSRCRRASCETTRLLLDLSTAPASRATFFVVGWVAERHPRLVDEIAARRATKSARTATRTRARLRARPGRLRRRSAAQRRGADAPPARRRARCSARRNGRSTTGRSGRSSCWSRKASRSTRAWRRCSMVGGVDVSAASARPADRRRARSSRCRRSSPIDSVRSMPLGWGWGLRMSSPRAGAAGDRGGEPRGRAGRADGASLGDRSGPAARARCRRGCASPTTSGSAASAQRLARRPARRRLRRARRSARRVRT